MNHPTNYQKILFLLFPRIKLKKMEIKGNNQYNIYVNCIWSQLITGQRRVVALNQSAEGTEFLRLGKLWSIGRKFVCTG